MALTTQNVLSGIQGWVSAGNATVDLLLNRRFKSLLFNCASGSAAPVAIATTLNWVSLDINGTKMLDWTPAMFTASYLWDGLTNSLRTGQLYIPFSIPRMAGFFDSDVTSFDLAGVDSAQMTFSLPTVTTPTVVASQQFDYERNIVPSGPDAGQYFLRPIKRLRQSFTIAGSATGLGSQTDITQIPISSPIKRLILIPDNAGTLTHYEIYADGAKIDEGDWQVGSSATWVNDAMTRQLTYGVGGQLAQIVNTAGVALPLTSYPLDFCYDKQLSSALVCKNSLTLRVWSNHTTSQNLAIAEEFIPFGYR